MADDEFFLSWLKRMANVNCFKNVSDFNYKNGNLSSPIAVFMKHYNYFVKLQFHLNLFNLPKRGFK